MATIANLHLPTLEVVRRIHEHHAWLMRLHQGMELLRAAARRLIPEFDSIEPHEARWRRLGAEVCRLTSLPRADFTALQEVGTILEVRTAADMKAADARAEAEKMEKAVAQALREVQAAAEKKEALQDGRTGAKSFRLGGWDVKDLTPTEADLLEYLWKCGVDVEVKRSAVMKELYGPTRPVKRATVDQHKKNLKGKLFRQTDGTYDIPTVNSDTYTLAKLG